MVQSPQLLWGDDCLMFREVSWSEKYLLQAGLIWRVGNDRNIQIWKDKWFPQSAGHPPLPIGEGTNDKALVTDQID